MSVTVELSQAPLAEVTVPITVTAQGSTTASDYTVFDLTNNAL